MLKRFPENVPRGLRRHTLQLPCQFQEDGGHSPSKSIKNKFPTFMHGCSEEVPNLKAQRLCEEILSLSRCLNKRRDSPGLGLMAALEGGPAEGKGGAPRGPGFLPGAHLWRPCRQLLPVPEKMQHPGLSNPIDQGNPFPGCFLHCKRN